MCMSVWVCLWGLTCTDAYSAHGCMVYVGGKATDGLQPSPLRVTPLLPFTLPSLYFPHHPLSLCSTTSSPLSYHPNTHTHTQTDTETEKLALTAVASPHMWTVGLKSQEAEHVFNLTCLPIRGPSLLLNQKGLKLTICPNIISKRVKKLTMTYPLLSPISHICPAENGVKVSATCRGRFTHTLGSLQILYRYWGWGKVQMLSSASVLFSLLCCICCPVLFFPSYF